MEQHEAEYVLDRATAKAP